jgi:hypothetical protein
MVLTLAVLSGRVQVVKRDSGGAKRSNWTVNATSNSAPAARLR